MDPNGRPEKFSVMAGLEPFTWSQDDAVAYEVAVDTIGMVIACYTGRIAAEERRAHPDQQRLQEWAGAITRAISDRRALSSGDRAHVDQVTADYAALHRRLRHPADA